MIEKILPIKNTYRVAQSKPKKIDFNNKAFYDSHPDLMPRNNMLLYLGRVISREKINKQFDETFKPTLWERTKNWFKNIFNK